MEIHVVVILVTLLEAELFLADVFDVSPTFVLLVEEYQAFKRTYTHEK